MAIRNPKDFWTGIIYLAFGGLAFWIARTTGWERRVGWVPATFPRY
jgi:hypothetical protein